jgi:hypothetical protein
MAAASADLSRQLDDLLPLVVVRGAARAQEHADALGLLVGSVRGGQLQDLRAVSRAVDDVCLQARTVGDLVSVMESARANESPDSALDSRRTIEAGDRLQAFFRLSLERFERAPDGGALQDDRARSFMAGSEVLLDDLMRQVRSAVPACEAQLAQQDARGQARVDSPRPAVG